jgi:hypothetical protein
MKKHISPLRPSAASPASMPAARAFGPKAGHAGSSGRGHHFASVAVSAPRPAAPAPATGPIQCVRVTLPDGTEVETDHLPVSEMERHESALEQAVHGGNPVLEPHYHRMARARLEREGMSEEEIEARLRQLQERSASTRQAPYARYLDRSRNVLSAELANRRLGPVSTPDVEGFATPLYTGTHFGTDMADADYDSAVAAPRVGVPTYAPAVGPLAATTNTTPARAARTLRDEMAAARQGPAVQQWWGEQKQTFANPHDALQQRYVNTYGDAEREFKAEERPAAYDGMSARDIPLVSTSESPAEAVKFARGLMEKGRGAQRKRRTIGEVSTYVVPTEQFQRLGGFSVMHAHQEGQIKAKTRYLGQEEVNFPGFIPGSLRVASRPLLGRNPRDLTEQIEADAEREVKRQKRVIAHPRGPRRLVFQREDPEQVRLAVRAEAQRRERAAAQAQHGQVVDPLEERARQQPHRGGGATPGREREYARRTARLKRRLQARRAQDEDR